MGGGVYSDSKLSSFRTSKAASGAKPFDYSRTASVTHKMARALDPAYGGKRYSKNPAPGQNARPVTVLVDVTGSNIENALKVRDDLPHLMSLLASQNWINGHLNLQIGAIGDTTCDPASLQLGWFEIDGVKLDAQLDLMWLVKGGGGGKTESYQNAMWAMCYQNDLEIWQSGGKGDLFIIFDEMPYPEVKLSELEAIYGTDNSIINSDIDLTDNQKTPSLKNGLALPQSNIPLKVIVAELHRKYNVWGIIGAESSYYTDEEVLKIWRDILGQNLIKLPDAGDVSKMIAAILGSRNGVSTADIYGELTSMGADKRTLDAIGTALTISNVAHPSVLPPSSGDSRVTRL